MFLKARQIFLRFAPPLLLTAGVFSPIFWYLKRQSLGQLSAGTWDFGIFLGLLGLGFAGLWNFGKKRGLKEGPQALLHNEARIKVMAENSGEVISLFSLEPRVLWVSESIQRVLGYAPSERLGVVPYDIVHPADRAEAQKVFQACANEKGSTASLECRLLHASGRRVWAAMYLSNHLETPGINAMVLTSRDVTVEHEAREALRKSEALFRALSEDSSEVLVLMSAEGRVLYASQSMKNVTGYNPTERVGSHSNGVLHPEDRDQVWKVFRQAVEDPSRTYTFESRLLHHDGHYIHTAARLRNFLDDSAVSALVLNYRDVTKEREAQQALIKNKARYEALLEMGSDVTLLLDEAGRIIQYSRAGERILGYTGEERVGHSVGSKAHPEDYAKVQEVFQKALESPGQPFRLEYRVRAKDDTWRWLDAKIVNRLADTAIGAMVVTYQDVTERHQNLDALRQSEEFYRTLIKNTSDLVLIYRPDGKVSYENPDAAKASLGYDSEEINALGSFDFVHPDDLAQVFGQAERMQQMPEGRGQLEIRLKAKDGSWKTFNSRSINLISNPVVGGILIHLRDISMARDAQKQVLRFERLAAIGQTAAGLAHEVRNPLAVISTCAQFLKLQLADRPVLFQDLDSILRQTERLKALVSEVLEQSHSDDLKLSEAWADELMRSALKAAQLRFGQASERIDLRLDFSTPSPRIRADMPQMERVLLNLILNAFQAMYAGGALTLGLRLQSDGLVLEVGDNGPGIAEEKMAKIFEPFFTTKETGSGLGLWICKSIVGQHGGRLEVFNLKPQGCLFRVILPPAQGGAA